MERSRAFYVAELARRVPTMARDSASMTVVDGDREGLEA